MEQFKFEETETGYEACIYGKRVSISKDVLKPKKGLMLDDINHTSAGRRSIKSKPQITIFCVGSLSTKEEVVSLFLKMKQEEKLQHASNQAVTSSACMLDDKRIAVKVTCETLSGARSKVVRLDSLAVAKVVIKSPDGLLKVSPTRRVKSWEEIKALVRSMDYMEWMSEDTNRLIDDLPM